MRDQFQDEVWFNTDHRPNKDGRSTFFGEDVFFFDRLKKMGIPAYLDCDVQCEHFGGGMIGRETFELAKRLRAEKALKETEHA